MINFGDKFNEADARKINVTDKATEKLLMAAEMRQQPLRLLVENGSVELSFDKPKYDDKVFIEKGMPILLVDRSAEGAIGDVLIDAADENEPGMLSIRRWDGARYGEPETFSLAA